MNTFQLLVWFLYFSYGAGFIGSWLGIMKIAETNNVKGVVGWIGCLIVAVVWPIFLIYLVFVTLNNLNKMARSANVRMSVR